MLRFKYVSQTIPNFRYSPFLKGNSSKQGWKMETEKLLQGKRVLIVDDEPDILDSLTEILSICMIDRASTFEEAKELLETYSYDVAVLDIMGVKGFELLQIAKEKDIPALMLTAHALSEETLTKSAEEGASYYVPKDETVNIDLFVADVIEAREKKKNPWVRWLERLGPFFEKRTNFRGPNWLWDSFWGSVKIQLNLIYKSQFPFTMGKLNQLGGENGEIVTGTEFGRGNFSSSKPYNKEEKNEENIPNRFSSNASCRHSCSSLVCAR
jgi:CheY-like chemotaxis protein